MATGTGTVVFMSVSTVMGTVVYRLCTCGASQWCLPPLHTYLQRRGEGVHRGCRLLHVERHGGVNDRVYLLVSRVTVTGMFRETDRVGLPYDPGPLIPYGSGEVVSSKDLSSPTSCFGSRTRVGGSHSRVSVPQDSTRNRETLEGLSFGQLSWV